MLFTNEINIKALRKTNSIANSNHNENNVTELILFNFHN
jgi:hypothetical protein